MDKAKKINKNKIQKQTQIKNQKKQTRTQSKKLSKNDLHFCETNNKLFKKIYLFLNNPKNMQLTMYYIRLLHHPKAKPLVLEQLKEHKKEIKSMLENFRVILSFYKQNNKILKSDIGHFIMYYEYHLNKTKMNCDKDYLQFFYTLLAYPKLFSLLKNIFYILSDYRACLYFASPHISMNKSNLNTIQPIIQKFRSNQTMLFSMITGLYPGDNCPWGSPFYTGAYNCFESLIQLKKFYKQPLKELKIEFKYKKKNLKIHQKIEQLYNVKLNQKQKVNNSTQFIIFMKKLGYDLYQVVDALFEMVYEKPIFKNIQDCFIVDAKKIYHQKKNYEYGIKIFLLVENDLINNINCFDHFRF
jgi:hypothetical protein